MISGVAVAQGVKVGYPLIERSVAPPVHVLQCPWARY